MGKPSAEAELIARQAARIRDLEAMIDLNNPSYTTLFKLSASQTQLFGLLMSAPNVTSDMVQQRLGIVSDTKVAMHRLRTHLENWSAQYAKEHTAECPIDIQSRRTLGYWLDDETKRRVNGLITTGVTMPETEDVEG